MNRILLALCSLVLIFTACQKETSFEKPIPAEGSLQDSFGDCMPSDVNGIYTTGQSLVDSHFVAIWVIVTKPGAYTITTDTVNGYHFKATGTFNAVDTFPVVLKGAGTPSNAGTDRFTVKFNNTFCAFEVDVLQGTGGGNTAVYTLNNSSPGTCSTQVNGSYAVGTPTNASNSVVLNVNVTTVGSWSITTSAGGITFSGAGTFVNTGNNQTITLNASGTPTNGGTQNFSVTAGSSTCTFPVTITGGVTPPPTAVYLPLTNGTYWTYEDDQGDTSLTTVVGPVTIAGTNYQLVKTTLHENGDPDSDGYGRKTVANAYFSRFDTTGLYAATGAKVNSGASIDVEILRDVLTTGQAWNSSIPVTVTIAPFPAVSGQIRFNWLVLNSNATTTINGRTFNNVYEIKQRVTAEAGGIPFPGGYPTTIVSYAPNVGPIKVVDSASGTVVSQIRFFRIN